MKKISFLTFLSVALLWASCSNDFDVTAKWKNIPVVYGLLDLSDTAHYIRVEKAFLDPDANALELAKIPDSLYYENAVVQLERVSNGQLFTLERVDGNMEGFPREDGIFATSPNYLYKIDSAEILLQGGETIRLHVNRGNGLPDVTAETVVLSAGKIRDPDPVTNRPLDFKNYNLDENISFSPPVGAEIFDVTLVVKWAEYNVNDPSDIDFKTLEWPWAKGLTNDLNETQLTVEKKSRVFYELLANNLEADPDIKRIFQGIDIHVIAGGEALEKFTSVAQANTGITGSQDIPTFTNLSEGEGVFSSINEFSYLDVQLTQATQDSLKNGSITGDLNF